MKKKVLKGDETVKKVQQQELLINKQREELEIKKREEERLKEDLDEKSKNTVELKKKYDSKQAQIDDLTTNIQILVQKNAELKNEYSELGERYNGEEEKFRDVIKNYEIERKKYEFIIKYFITPEEKERVEKSLDYIEKENIYKINPKKAIINNYKTNMEKLKEMKKTKLLNKKQPVIKEDQINLKLIEPDSMCFDFSEKPMEDILRGIEKVLVDDDSDLLYFDKELNINTSTLNPGIVGVPPKKVDSKETSASSKIGFNKPIIRK